MMMDKFKNIVLLAVIAVGFVVLITGDACYGSGTITVTQTSDVTRLSIQSNPDLAEEDPHNEAS
jgi:hypothetical protein